MCPAVVARVWKSRARDLNLIRDRVEGEERAKRRRNELTRVLALSQNPVTGAKCADIMGADVLAEFLELATEVVCRFSSVSGAATTRYRVPG